MLHCHCFSITCACCQPSSSKQAAKSAGRAGLQLPIVEGTGAGPAAAATSVAGWEDINAMLRPVTESCVTGFWLCGLLLLLLLLLVLLVLAVLFPASKHMGCYAKNMHHMWQAQITHA
jgi:hypothetical protein